MATILSSRQAFSPEVIPEVEYARKIAIRYINFKIRPTMWSGDIINDVMNIYLYKCSYNLMVPMHKKFNDNIFACFLVITKMLLFHL